MGDQTPGAKPWGERLFEDGETVRRLLETKLGAAHLAKRSGGGNMTYAFVESWKAIELANSIFGFDGWYLSINFSSFADQLGVLPSESLMWIFTR